MKLIATWKQSQDPEADPPIRVRWEDGAPATIEDFERIDSGSQSYPYIEGDTIEFGYETR
jgi:hypothetical protein